MMDNDNINVYFDSDKLYVVKPSIVVCSTSKVVELEQQVKSTDIAYVEEKMIGLISGREYKELVGKPVFGEWYVDVFPNDRVQILKYLFELVYDIPCTKEFLDHISKIKRYYELQELKELIVKITDIEQDKKIKRFKNKI